MEDMGPLLRAALDYPNDAHTESFVYLIYAKKSKLVKIGVAREPRVRLARFQTGNHEELCLLAILAGDQALEHELHEQFAAHRVRGEWFTFTKEMGDIVVAAYEAATGNTFVLPVVEEREGQKQ